MPPRKKNTAGAKMPVSALLHEMAVEKAPNAVLVVGADGRIVLVNEQTERLFGYQRGELIAQKMEILVPPRYRQAHVGHRTGFFEKPSARAMGAGRDLYGLRKDGTEVPIEIGLNPIKTKEGAFTLACIIDNTERKRSEERFRMAVEAAPNAMLMVGPDGWITMVNAQAEKLFGYKREEMLGRPIEMLVPRKYQQGHVAQRDKYFEKPSQRSMGAGRDLCGLRKDGAEVPVEIGLNPIETPEGRFVLASIIDITERRDMERKLQHTEVLAAIGSMVAVVAHEIRNPLGSVSMAAKALVRGGLTPAEQAEVLNVLDSESRRLNATISDFLHYARPRQPKLALGDINAAAHEVLSALKTEVGAAKITVKTMLDSDLPKLSFDADQMRQVLWNLIRNAFQALDGKGRLEVKTEVVSGKVAVRIRDTGPGIPADKLEKLFTPFFTTKTHGTGLGLSISRNIVLSHGGDIHVDTEPGRGTEFTMLLPIPR